MLLIDHRVNTSARLASLARDCGAEIDLRDYDGEIRLTHDPLSSGEKLGDWLKGWKHALCVYNVKCDGLELQVREAGLAAGVKDYFFLDCAAPTLVRLARGGEKNLAVRFSEYEPLEGALAFEGLASWAWVDCFSKLSLTRENYPRLKKAFKICLVSPELQGHGKEAIAQYRQQLKDLGAEIDAVCTDFLDAWR